VTGQIVEDGLDVIGRPVRGVGDGGHPRGGDELGERDHPLHVFEATSEWSPDADIWNPRDEQDDREGRRALSCVSSVEIERKPVARRPVILDITLNARHGHARYFVDDLLQRIGMLL